MQISATQVPWGGMACMRCVRGVPYHHGIFVILTSTSDSDGVGGHGHVTAIYSRYYVTRESDPFTANLFSQTH